MRRVSKQFQWNFPQLNVRNHLIFSVTLLFQTFFFIRNESISIQLWIVVNSILIYIWHQIVDVFSGLHVWVGVHCTLDNIGQT